MRHDRPVSSRINDGVVDASMTKGRKMTSCFSDEKTKNSINRIVMNWWKTKTRLTATADLVDIVNGSLESNMARPIFATRTV